MSWWFVFSCVVIAMGGGGIVLTDLRLKSRQGKSAGRSSVQSVAFGLSFTAVLLVALRSIATTPWFEDDAMITLQYSKNLASGCGWNFNCSGDDFATSSYLQTIIGSVWFTLFSTARALQVEKVWEVFLVVAGSLAFIVGSVKAGASRCASLLAVAVILLTTNSFIYLFSGMENALGFLVLALIFMAFAYDRPVTVGALVGVAALVRPEYAMSGLIVAFLDTVRPHIESFDARRWLRRWAAAAVFAVLVFAPVFLVVWRLNGAPFPDTLEIKRLTAANWGAQYHEEIWPLTRSFGVTLPFFGLGFLGLLLEKSRLLFWPIFAILISLIYARLGLPRSPWYYMPFWSGFAASVMGFPFMWRLLKRSWSIRWLPPQSFRTAFAIAGSLLFVALAFGNPITQGKDNNRLVERIAAKRFDINAALGRHFVSTTATDVRIAIPNIGYVGFFSDRFIVDLVGLVTPEASLRVSASAWRDFNPDYYVDKAVIAERLFQIEGYRFQRVVGSRQHRGERFVVLERVNTPEFGSSTLLDVREAVRASPGVWRWPLVSQSSKERELNSGELYLSAKVASGTCVSVRFTIVDVQGRQAAFESYYESRDGFMVADTTTLTGLDWGRLSHVTVACAEGSELSEAPAVHFVTR